MTENVQRASLSAIKKGAFKDWEGFCAICGKRLEVRVLSLGWPRVMMYHGECIPSWEPRR